MGENYKPPFTMNEEMTRCYASESNSPQGK